MRPDARLPQTDHDAEPAAAQTAAAPAADDHAGHGAAPVGAANSSLVFFNPDKADFIRAHVDTLIPPSADGPSATQAGVDV